MEMAVMSMDAANAGAPNEGELIKGVPPAR